MGKNNDLREVESSIGAADEISQYAKDSSPVLLFILHLELKGPRQDLSSTYSNLMIRLGWLIWIY